MARRGVRLIGLEIGLSNWGEALTCRRMRFSSGSEVSNEVAPYVPRTGHCSRQAFEAEGWKAALG